MVETGLEALVRAILLLLSTYHVVTGVVSVGFVDFSERFYQRLYHFHPQMTEQYKLILRPWGALALFAGVVGLFAAWDPHRYRGVVWGLVLLLCMRVAYRTLLSDEMEKVFRIDKGRNRVNTYIIAAEVVILVVWLLTSASPAAG